MEYRWYKNNRLIVKSVDIERNIFVNGSITQEYFDDYIGNQKHYEGRMNLFKSDISSLGKLESVSKWLSVSGTKITSLDNLKTVCSNLIVINTNLTSLGKLKTVGGDIYCTKGSTTHKLLMNSKFKDQVIAE